MKNIKKRLKSFLCLVLSMIMICSLNIQTVSALELDMNIQTFPVVNGKSVPPGSSTVSDTAGLLKVTLYMQTTNDTKSFPVNADGKVDWTKADINKMAKFGYSMMVAPAKTLYGGRPAYTNIITDKIDAIKDLNAGKKFAPSYKFGGSYLQITSSNNTLVTISDLPYWYLNNGVNIGAVKNYFQQEKNLKDLIKAIANKYSTGVTLNDKVNNLLSTTKQKSNFDFKDKNGQTINIEQKHIIPGDKDFIANWLVVVEPAFYYNEDPLNYSRSADGGNNTFAMTATDATLTTLNSGASGYPSNVKFAPSNRTYTIFTCSKCSRFWFRYTSMPATAPLCVKSKRYIEGNIEVGEGQTREDIIKYFDCLSRDNTTITMKSWVPFEIGIIPFKEVSPAMTPDKNWFNGFITPPNSVEDFTKARGIERENNVIKNGGVGLFATSAVTKVEETAVFEVKVVDLNMKALVGAEIQAGLYPQQDAGPIKDNEVQVLTKAKNETEKNNINKFANDSIDLVLKKNELVNLTKVPVYSKEDFVTVQFETAKISNAPINEIMQLEMLNNTSVGINVNPSTIAKKDKVVYLYSTKLLELHRTIASLVANAQDYKSYLSEYLTEIQKVKEDFRKYLSENTGITAEEIYSRNRLALSNGDIIICDTDLGNITNEIDWKNLFLIEGINPNINSPLLKNVIIDKSNPKKVNVILPVIIQEVNLAPVAMTNDIEEDELTKGVTYTNTPSVSLRHTVNYTWCDGWKEVAVRDKDGKVLKDKNGRKVYETVPCGHNSTLANATNASPREVTITKNMYWNISMLSGVDKLSVLRTDSGLTNNGVNLAFNVIGDFKATNMDNVFETINEYSFVAHRSGNGAAKLELAAYMNNTQNNKDYYTFINPYYPNYPSAYKNASGKFGDNSYSFKTSLALPSSVNASGLVEYCNGNSNIRSIPSVLESGGGNKFEITTQVNVNPTIKETNKTTSKSTFATAYTDIESNNATYHIRIPSKTYTFNPTFKMNYYTDNKSITKKQAWILAGGDRIFNSTDYIKIALTYPEVKVTSPWSRDSEDKNETNPTTKSGSMIKATANGASIVIDAYINVLDPNFVGNPGSAKYNAAQTALNNTVIDYNNAVQSIIDEFKTGTSFYTNLYQAAGSNTLHKLASPSNFEDLTDKTLFKYPNPISLSVSSGTQAFYVDANASADFTINSRAVNINGTNVTVNKKWTDNDVVKSESKLKELIITNKGKNGWYNEDYEGLVVIHKRWIVTFTSLETDYAQIHPQHSDSLTEKNELAKPLKFNFNDTYLINDGDGYGIGVEFKIKSTTVNGQTIPTGALVSKPFLYNIRGSVYDN